MKPYIVRGMVSNDGKNIYGETFRSPMRQKISVCVTAEDKAIAVDKISKALETTNHWKGWKFELSSIFEMRDFDMLISEDEPLYFISK